MSYLDDYMAIVEKYEREGAPEIIVAFTKLDKNKDDAKRKPLMDAASKEIAKWDQKWTAENKDVADNKEKLARSQFAVEVRKLKQGMDGIAKKVPLCDDFIKARAEMPVGRGVAALWALDRATAPQELKPLVTIALKELNNELVALKFDLGRIKDPALKGKLAAYDKLVRDTIAKVKELAG